MPEKKKVSASKVKNEEPTVTMENKENPGQTIEVSVSAVDNYLTSGYKKFVGSEPGDVVDNK